MGMKNLKFLISNPVEDSIYFPFRAFVFEPVKDDSMDSEKRATFYILTGSIRHSVWQAVESSLDRLRNIRE